MPVKPAERCVLYVYSLPPSCPVISVLFFCIVMTLFVLILYSFFVFSPKLAIEFIKGLGTTITTAAVAENDAPAPAPTSADAVAEPASAPAPAAEAATAAEALVDAPMEEVEPAPTTAPAAEPAAEAAAAA